MPPAFALSQDQTLKFITRSRAKARPRGNRSAGLRSPLSMRSAPSNPRHRHLPSRKGLCRQDRKHLLASKKPMRLSKITPPSGPARHGGRGIGPTRGSPASLRGERACARGHETWDLQPHGPSLPKARNNTRRHRRPGWKEQPLRCGRPDLAPRGTRFKASPGTSPKGTASRRTPKMMPSGTGFKTRSPGSLEEEPPFGAHRKWCLPTKLQSLLSRPQR